MVRKRRYPHTGPLGMRAGFLKVPSPAVLPEWEDANVQPSMTESVSQYLNVGAFRFWFVGQRWEWSDEVARMHGYEPGSVVPTTEILLSHKQAEHRAPVQDLLHGELHSKRSLSSRHRFRATAGNVHDAIVVADR